MSTNALAFLLTVNRKNTATKTPLPRIRGMRARHVYRVMRYLRIVHVFVVAPNRWDGALAAHDMKKRFREICPTARFYDSGEVTPELRENLRPCRTVTLVAAMSVRDCPEKGREALVCMGYTKEVFFLDDAKKNFPTFSQ